MFKKLKAKFKELNEKAKLLEKQHYQKMIKKFDDVVAKKTEWSPLKRGGSNFQTSSLVKQSSNILKFKLSLATMLFFGVFTIASLIMIIIAVLIFADNDNATMWGLLSLGLSFFILSIVGYKFMGKPTYFNRSIGVMYKGNKAPVLSGDQHSSETTYFADIHAIQILQETIRSKNNSFYSYEINLILKDGNRINVVDHGKYVQIAKDAQTLSAFLGKPVWDAVNL